jgi:homoserine dehydrogenase
MGYCIKLLGVARRRVDGIELSVQPALVPQTSLLAHVDDRARRSGNCTNATTPACALRACTHGPISSAS